MLLAYNNILPVKDQHTEMMQCLFEAVSQTHCHFCYERYDDDEDDDNAEGLVDGETSLFCVVHPGCIVDTFFCET